MGKRAGCVGLFWFIEERGSAALLARAVPLPEADRYDDMLTVHTGHAEYWAALVGRGAHALQRAGLPTAPLWSDYDEWPRGRVLYDCTRKRFVIRADWQLHRRAFVRAIADRFDISGHGPLVLPDDHYQSVRRVPVPSRTPPTPDMTDAAQAILRDVEGPEALAEIKAAAARNRRGSRSLSAGSPRKPKSR